MTEPIPEAFAAARQHFVDGLAAFERGRFDDAERHFLASLERLPRRVSTLVNLAATRVQLGRADAAIDAAAQVLALEPDNADAWFHRAEALVLLQRDAEAVPSYAKVIAAAGERAEPWFGQAQALQRLGRADEALACFDRTVAIDPTLALAWSLRGTALREAGRFDDAAASFRQALAHGADAELNRYYLAAVSERRGAPPPAPRPYVESLFDDYAGQFDDHLVRVLRYRGHAALVELAGLPSSDLSPPGRWRSALDLGCGTGLCGPLLRPRALRLTGVDLSRRMLDEAVRTRAYDALVHADILAYLQQADESHDLVVAADVFIYIADLAPVFAAVRQRLGAGGRFCFSAEPASRDDIDVELLPSLRYAHSARHLQALAARHGLVTLQLTRQPIREDQHRPVDAWFMCLARP